MQAVLSFCPFCGFFFRFFVEKLTSAAPHLPVSARASPLGACMRGAVLYVALTGRGRCMGAVASCTCQTVVPWRRYHFCLFCGTRGRAAMFDDAAVPSWQGSAGAWLRALGRGWARPAAQRSHRCNSVGSVWACKLRQSVVHVRRYRLSPPPRGRLTTGPQPVHAPRLARRILPCMVTAALASSHCA